MAWEGQGNPEAMGVYTWGSVDTSTDVKGDRTAGVGAAREKERYLSIELFLLTQ